MSKIAQPDAIEARKASENGTNPEQPVFSFMKFGLLDQMRFAEIQTEMMQFQAEGQRLAKLAQDDPTADVDAEALGKMRDAAKYQRELLQMICKVLVSVPRGWLVEDAPDEIDWQIFDNLNFVRGNRQGDLMTAFSVTMQGRHTPGNSATS